MLVIDKLIVDLTLKTPGLQLIFPVLTLFKLDCVHVDFVDLDGVLSPLASQVLLVECEQASILGDFDLNLRILVAVSVQQVQGRGQNRDALLIPIHVFLVGVGLGLDLLCQLVHESRQHLVDLLAIS